MLEELKEKHIDELHKLLNYDSKDEEHFHPHSFEKSYLHKLLKEKLNHYFVLIIDNKVVGYSMLRTFGIFPHPTFGGIIHKDYRGKGFGSILLLKTLEMAIVLEFEKVLLKVDEDNEIAINLYKKVGFKEIQRGKDKLWMEIKL